MRIVFMGTSDFAIPALTKILNQKNHEIIAVYTKHPSIAGRNNKINYSPIYNYAKENNIKIYTPKNLKDFSVQKDFASLKPDLVVVVSYGLILPIEILTLPKYGCFNIHPSNLPLYRGSAPLQRSIMNNEKTSAVCIIKMDLGLDSGDIVLKEKFNIDDKDDFLSISKTTSEIGAKLILKTIHIIEKEELKLEKQNNVNLTFAPKIEKHESLIDWKQNCREIFNKIRALRGNLGAYFLYRGEKIKILQCKYEVVLTNKNDCGTIIDNEFSISCKDGFIKPLKLQRAGKNQIELREFINGFKFKIGDRLVNY